ncbi:hypothetical protein BKK51_01105 [Rodentibacter trehalosifermentans]|uniref:UDP-diphosphatase n=1 Tax=Rodentibacter trehalosifermentans TaxID=1908263 RepID=A0A1V3IX28_9PAST|nr:hypothetical protein [Rodentibacter trehalosifermentans]OOF46839.1 hypothetical protein BKK51_01105 [Rodentibacter trehalosifermentans]
MNKNDVFKILKATIFSLIILYLYILSKFNFNFDRVNIVPILKFSPILFLLLGLCFILGRFLRGNDRSL